MLRGYMQREAEREQQIKRRFLALGREIRRGRCNHRRAEGLLRGLSELCGGGIHTVAERWAEFLKELFEKEPGSVRAMRGLMAMVEVIRLASQEQLAPSAPPARKGRHRKKPPDFSAWTDEELRALVEMHERRMPPKADNQIDTQVPSAKLTNQRRTPPWTVPEADQTAT
jgi:hypothetical protein